MPPASPSRAWELGDAFMEGLTLFADYPIERAGGVERILQIANDLGNQRLEMAKTPKQDNSTFSAVLMKTVWGNASSYPGHSDTSSEDSSEDGKTLSLRHIDGHIDDGDETETPGFASRLRTAVWKGISNQTAMEPPVSPLSPLAPSSNLFQQNGESESKAHSQVNSVPQPATTSIWGYASKLKDSDMAARLSKVSTNLTVKAMGAWHTRQDSSEESASSTIHSPKPSLSRTGSSMLQVPGSNAVISHEREDSPQSPLYEPPARPAYFRPPRDSWMPQPSASSSPGRIDSPDSAVSSHSVSSQSVSDSVAEASRRLHMSLVSIPGLASASQKHNSLKSGPRPLLLNSTNLITAPSQAPIIPDTSTEVPSRDIGPWADILRKKIQTPRHRDSQSSVSSFSSDVRRSRHRGEEWDSDTSVSRVVPLNRARVSSRAPSFRSPRYRESSISSRSENEPLSPPSPLPPSIKVLPTKSHTPPHKQLSPPSRLLDAAFSGSDGSGSARSWEHVDRLDSPVTLPSSLPLKAPATTASIPSTSDGVSSRDSRASTSLSEYSTTSLKPTTTNKRPTLKVDPSSVPQLQDVGEGNSDSSASPVVPRTPTRLTRSRRYQQRPPNLRVHGSNRAESGSLQDATSDPGSLGPPEALLTTDLATTPKAVEFPLSTSPVDARSPRRLRKLSAEAKTNKDVHPVRPRKISTDHRRTESAANEGDDEGYDDLLSAYESEEGYEVSAID